MYGLWNKYPSQTAPVANTNLLAQSITAETILMADTNDDGAVDTEFQARKTSQHAIDWGVHGGWSLELTYCSTNGEQVTAAPILREGKVLFSTHILSGDQCTSGETGWFLSLDAISGAMPKTSPFDLNNDRIFGEDRLSALRDLTNPLTEPVVASTQNEDVIVSTNRDDLTIGTVALDAVFEDGRLSSRELNR